MSIDLSVIIVNWNVCGLLRDCLCSLYAGPGAALASDGLLHVGRYRLEVYVVDNASSDSSVAMVRSEYPQVHLLASAENLGFARGNNLALRCCQGRYVLLLNPDTRLTGSALSTLLDYAESHPDVAALGPRLVDGAGHATGAYRRFPRLATALVANSPLQGWSPLGHWAKRLYHDPPDDAVQEVDWIVGACMLISRAALESVGLLDEGFFMYYEEVDWCKRAADAGWRTAYLPQAVVIHYGGGSSSQATSTRDLAAQRSILRYIFKHHGALQAQALRCFMLLGSAVRLVCEGLGYALGHARPTRKPHIAARWEALRSGLRLAPEPGAGHERPPTKDRL